MSVNSFFKNSEFKTFYISSFHIDTRLFGRVSSGWSLLMWYRRKSNELKWLGHWGHLNFLLFNPSLFEVFWFVALPWLIVKVTRSFSLIFLIVMFLVAVLFKTGLFVSDVGCWVGLTWFALLSVKSLACAIFDYSGFTGLFNIKGQCPVIEPYFEQTHYQIPNNSRT